MKVIQMPEVNKSMTFHEWLAEIQELMVESEDDKCRLRVGFMIMTDESNHFYIYRGGNQWSALSELGLLNLATAHVAQQTLGQF